MPPNCLREDDGDTIIDVDVQPAAHRAEVVGIEPWRGRLKVTVTVQPQGGAANLALLDTLAGWIGVKKSDLSIESGHSSRRKSVRVAGVQSEAIEGLLED